MAKTQDTQQSDLWLLQQDFAMCAYMLIHYQQMNDYSFEVVVNNMLNSVAKYCSGSWIFACSNICIWTQIGVSLLEDDQVLNLYFWWCFFFFLLLLSLGSSDSQYLVPTIILNNAAALVWKAFSAISWIWMYLLGISLSFDPVIFIPRPYLNHRKKKICSINISLFQWSISLALIANTLQCVRCANFKYVKILLWFKVTALVPSVVTDRVLDTFP